MSAALPLQNGHQFLVPGRTGVVSAILLELPIQEFLVRSPLIAFAERVNQSVAISRPTADWAPKPSSIAARTRAKVASAASA